MPEFADYLAANGIIAQHIKHFAPRPSQQAMAQAIWDALNTQTHLVCEAGTGTGKTFAYLVPALLFGKKVVVSTGTKNLQDQLVQRDIPLIQDALNRPIQVALLKGRGNYLCLQRLEQLEHAHNKGDLALSGQLHRQLNRIQKWRYHTATGETSELSEIPEKSEIWPKVTSTSDNCLGQECPVYKDCHLYKARHEAYRADVIVVNHHLLFADVSMHTGEDSSGVLPDVDAVIVDEAHQLPEVAELFLSQGFSSRLCLALGEDCLTAEQAEAGELLFEMQQAVDDLGQAIEHLRSLLGVPGQRAAWATVGQAKHFQRGLENTHAALQRLGDILAPLAQRGKSLENCYERCQQLRERVKAFQVGQTETTSTVQWFETFAQSFILHSTPLNIANTFQTFLEQKPRSWIFTSATLSTGGDFSYFCQQLGLVGVATQRWDSPFNFATAALVYLPLGLPDPSHAEYTEAMLAAAIPVLQASQGRAFLLFTSHKALQIAAKSLKKANLPYPLLVQGDMPRHQLINRFRQTPNALLLGTSSFWQGVDVRGEALSCVIIDKLPFASPGDPVLQARLNYIREQGGNPFFDYQVPQAAIALKQGVGRLIRAEADKGVLMLCDPRITSKKYGQFFLQSLPTMPITQNIADVQRFFESK